MKLLKMFSRVRDARKEVALVGFMIFAHKTSFECREIGSAQPVRPNGQGLILWAKGLLSKPISAGKAEGALP